MDKQEKHIPLLYKYYKMYIVCSFQLNYDIPYLCNLMHTAPRWWQGAQAVPEVRIDGVNSSNRQRWHILIFFFCFLLTSFSDLTFKNLNCLVIIYTLKMN